MKIGRALMILALVLVAGGASAQSTATIFGKDSALFCSSGGGVTFCSRIAYPVKPTYEKKMASMANVCRRKAMAKEGKGFPITVKCKLIGEVTVVDENLVTAVDVTGHPWEIPNQDGLWWTDVENLSLTIFQTLGECGQARSKGEPECEPWADSYDQLSETYSGRWKAESPF